MAWEWHASLLSTRPTASLSFQLLHPWCSDPTLCPLATPCPVTPPPSTSLATVWRCWTPPAPPSPSESVVPPTTWGCGRWKWGRTTPLSSADDLWPCWMPFCRLVPVLRAWHDFVMLLLKYIYLYIYIHVFFSILLWCDLLQRLNQGCLYLQLLLGHLLCGRHLCLWRVSLKNCSYNFHRCVWRLKHVPVCENMRISFLPAPWGAGQTGHPPPKDCELTHPTATPVIQCLTLWQDLWHHIFWNLYFTVCLPLCLDTVHSARAEHVQSDLWWKEVRRSSQPLPFCAHGWRRSVCKNRKFLGDNLGRPRYCAFPECLDHGWTGLWTASKCYCSSDWMEEREPICDSIMLYPAVLFDGTVYCWWYSKCQWTTQRERDVILSCPCSACSIASNKISELKKN